MSIEGDPTPPATGRQAACRCLGVMARVLGDRGRPRRAPHSRRDQRGWLQRRRRHVDRRPLGAAVDVEQLSGHPGRRRRGEVERGRGDVLGGAGALHRGVGVELATQVLVGQHDLEALGRDSADADRVDPDPRRELDGQVAGHLVERGLAGGVRHEVVEHQVRRAGRDVDDRAGAGRVDHRLAASWLIRNGWVDVEPHRPLEEPLRGLHRGARAGAAGVVDQHVEAPERRPRPTAPGAPGPPRRGRP